MGKMQSLVAALQRAKLMQHTLFSASMTFGENLPAGEGCAFEVKSRYMSFQLLPWQALLCGHFWALMLFACPGTSRFQALNTIMWALTVLPYCLSFQPYTTLFQSFGSSLGPLFIRLGCKKVCFFVGLWNGFD